MLLGSYQLLQDDPSGFIRLAVLVAFALVTAVTIHEFSHALVASGLGDNTARRLGRLSLNPMRHLDPGGTIMMFIAGFGWGKPVPVDPRQLSRGHTDTALVATAAHRRWYRPTIWIADLGWQRLMSCGSPTSSPTKAGSTWQWSSTCSLGRLWAGR